ncbi:MAG: hypothetical protein WAX14_19495 [Rhodococcus sp. (in: high G+C Gram-positive bacteria)]|uniref:hypothetical protein n=1 Tax=Rhodococcus sp. TaxID=1831 RepID=UPI003BB61499
MTKRSDADRLGHERPIPGPTRRNTMILIARSIVHATSTCSSHHDGHHIHHIRARHGLADRDLAVHVLVEVADGAVTLSWDGRRSEFRHHDVGAIAEALELGGDIGEWLPRWRVLVLPGVEPDRRTVFTLCDPGNWTECAGPAQE